MHAAARATMRHCCRVTRGRRQRLEPPSRSVHRIIFWADDSDACGRVDRDGELPHRIAEPGTERLNDRLFAGPAVEEGRALAGDVQPAKHGDLRFRKDECGNLVDLDRGADPFEVDAYL